MADLISREAALDVQKRAAYWQDGERKITELPAVDAVPVVRCRECRHCRLLNDGVSFECKELEMDFYAPQYDAATYYCADGERRDGA